MYYQVDFVLDFHAKISYIWVINIIDLQQIIRKFATMKNLVLFLGFLFFTTSRLLGQCPKQVFYDQTATNCITIDWSAVPEYIPNAIFVRGLRLNYVDVIVGTPYYRTYSAGGKCSANNLLPFDGAFSFFNAHGVEIFCNYSKGVLPLELSQFDAVATSEGIRVTWTANISDFQVGFELDKSYDAENWTPLSWNPNKAPNTPTKYEFVDVDQRTGLIYYRLTKINADGSFSYSDAISVLAGPKNAYTIAPNPTGGLLVLQSVIQEAIHQTKIFDVSGKLVQLDLAPGKTINISNQVLGVYFLQIDAPSGLHMLKFVKGE